MAKTAGGAPRGVTSSELGLSAIDRPRGETPLARSIGLKEKRSLGQRVLTVRQGIASEAARRRRPVRASFENEI